jgi:phosphoribosylformylglycinamidine synthase PurS subunit
VKARVTVTLKSGILDPQGKAIEGALKSLGVDGVASGRQGKVSDIDYDFFQYSLRRLTMYAKTKAALYALPMPQA